MILKDAIAQWTDDDVARFLLGECLGIFGPEVEFLDVKPLLLSSGELSEGLGSILDDLVRLGFLEKEGDPPKYRWNAHRPKDWK